MFKELRAHLITIQSQLAPNRAHEVSTVVVKSLTPSIRSQSPGLIERASSVFASWNET